MPDVKDSEERRNEFIDAAERLFKKNGIIDTTISSIVKEMDVAKGLFYYYFDSKNDVIEAISDKYSQIFNEMLDEQMDKPTYQERLEQYVENTVKSFRKLCNEFTENEEADLTSLRTRSVQDAKSIAISGLTKLFEEGMEIGEMNFVHPEYYADILVGGVYTLIDEGQASDEEIIEIIIDLIERSGKD